MTPIIFCCLCALMLPYMLIPMEIFGPISVVFEELAKVFMLLYLFRSGVKGKVLWYAYFGALLLFLISEDILYATNFMLLGNFDAMSLRILYTGIMHLCTGWILIYSFSYIRKIFIAAIIAAMGLHIVCNWLVMSRMLTGG